MYKCIIYSDIIDTFSYVRHMFSPDFVTVNKHAATILIQTWFIMQEFIY